MRQNPKFSAEEAITQLEVGEALISFLDEKGTPNVVERAFVLPPASQIGAITSFDRTKIVQASVLYGHYEKAEDRESAYEKLRAGVKAQPPQAGGLRERATGGANRFHTGDSARARGAEHLGPNGRSIWRQQQAPGDGGVGGEERRPLGRIRSSAAQ